MQIVRIAVAPYSPWVEPCVLRARNFKLMGTICGQFPGVSAQVIQLLFSIIASNYSAVLVPIYKKPNMTSWEALVESLNNGQSDIGLDLWEPTPDRIQRVSASYPLIYDEEALIVSHAAFRIAHGGLTLIPFDKYSIALISMFFCAVALLETAHTVIINANIAKNITWTLLIDNFYASLMRLSGQYDAGPLQLSISAALVAWTLSFAILVHAYNSLITDNLVSLDSAPFRTLDDLANQAEHGDLRLIINPGEPIVQNADAKLQQLIKKALFISDADEALNLIEQNKRLVYYESLLTAPFTISKQCSKFRIINTHQLPRPLSIISALNSTWANQLRSTVIAFQNTIELRAMSAAHGVACPPAKEGTGDAYTIALRLMHFEVAFVIAVSGYTLSTAMLLIERYKDELQQCVRATKTA